MAAGIEVSDIPWLAVGAGVLVNILVGFLWYAPQTPIGKAWMQEMKIPPDHQPDPKAMRRSMAIMVGGAFLTMFVLAHVMVSFRDAFRLDGVPSLGLMGGVTAGALVWLGFMVPSALNSVAFDNKSWRLFGINAGYYLVVMVLSGAIFAQFL